MDERHGGAPRTATSAATATQRGLRHRQPSRRRSSAQMGPTTSAGTTTPTGPFVRNAHPAAPRPAGATWWRAHPRPRSRQRREDRHRDEEGEWQVGQGEAPDREIPEGGGDDGAGEQARGFVVRPAPDRECRQRQADPGQPGPQPRLGLADSESRKRAGDEPVEENRLLEAVFVIVMGGDPVAELDHLAAGFGVNASSESRSPAGPGPPGT